jgi:hypothetical protein
MNTEQKVINFNYQNEMIDSKEVIYFNLETFPSVKFRYDNIRFGTPDEDNMVPIMFDLDVAHLKDIDEAQLGEDFNNQVKELLTYLLQAANNRAMDVINAPDVEGLTTKGLTT